MMKRVISFLPVFALVGGFVGGCGEREVVGPVEPASAGTPAASDRSPAAAVCQVAPGLEARLSIYPEQPTSADEVRACLSNVPPGYVIVWKRNGQIIADSDKEYLARGRVRRDDTLSVEVSFDEKTLAVSTTVQNSPPEIQAVNFADPHIHRGVDIVLEPVAGDADGDPASFRYTWWINGEEVPGKNDNTLPGDLFRKGDRVAVEVVGMDLLGEGQPFKGREFVIPNAPPKFVSEPPQSFTAMTYSYQARAEDADDEAVTYALTEAPEGMTIEAQTGQIRWNLAEKEAGDYRIRIKAVDEEGREAFQEFSLSLVAGERSS